MKRNRAMAKVSGTEGVVLQKLFAVKFQHPSKELALIGVIVLNVWEWEWVHIKLCKPRLTQLQTIQLIMEKLRAVKKAFMRQSVARE